MTGTRGFLHEALYYFDLEEFLVGSLAFIREGLDAGQPVLVAVPEPRLGLLRSELGASGGPVTFVNMAEAGRNPNRLLPFGLAFADGHPGRVRILGEPVFMGRPPEELAACVQNDAIVNVAFADRDAEIRCPYNVKQLDHIVPYAERTHPVIVDSKGRRPSKSYTDPYTVVALFNQPLPDRRRVDETMAFNVEGLARVRHLVGAYADSAGVAADRVADLQSAVVEIGANAVAHPVDGVATLRLWAEPDRVVCEIRGAGEIADIMAGRVLPEPDSPRGRGLLMANELCDLVQTHTAPTGTTTRLHMRLSLS